MADRVAMTSPASSGTVLVSEALVVKFKAQGWALVVAPEPVEPEPILRRGTGRPKKK